MLTDAELDIAIDAAKVWRCNDVTVWAKGAAGEIVDAEDMDEADDK